ncbi:MAG: hypothetical protein KGD60_04230 [Candidatus Thorarchaeota archaeon]|nr:hypothetical protein [Candidatus Thorarchaeota archaeon]
MSNSSGLSMLRADVGIRLVHTEEGMNASVVGQFSVISNVNQTAHLAFVYPEYWANYGQSYINIEQQIFVNGISVNYTIISWENLTTYNFQTDPTEFGGTWIEGAEFVLFSYPMVADETSLIKVITEAYPMENGHYSYFSYIVGSAKTFGDITHQTVEMHIVEEKQFLEFSFYPENFMTVSTNDTGTTATWDMIIDSSCNVSVVHFRGKVSEYVRVLPVPYNVAQIVGIGGSVVIIALILVVVFVRRRH